MKVTDKQYEMNDMLLKKLDIMIDRVTRKHPTKDALLLVEGDEGNGKTTMSVAIAYYVSYKTGREFNVNHLYFSAAKLTEFAKDTKEQIIIWDEPALEGMSSEWWKQTQRDLIRLLMMCRKKKHFIMFNITRFDKFKDYLIERAVGMVRVYARREVEPGRFLYYKKRSLVGLYNEWKRTRKRMYNVFRNFHGQFPDVLADIIDEKKYDKMKDEAIASIGVTAKEKQGEKKNLKLLAYQYLLTTVGSIKEISEKINMPEITVKKWRRLPEMYPEIKAFLNLKNKSCRLQEGLIISNPELTLTDRR